MFNLIFPETAEAATAIPAPVKTFIGKISLEIYNPIIAVLFALATVYFVYGVAAYIWNPEDASKREEGKRGMMWGIVGMFIMVSVFGIMKFILSTVGDPDNLMTNVGGT